MMQSPWTHRWSRVTRWTMASLMVVGAGCVHSGASASTVDERTIGPPNCSALPPVPAGLSGQTNGFSDWIANNLHFTGGGQHKALGASQTALDITAEARARQLAITCVTSKGNSYFVAAINYYNNQSQFSGWPSWTPSSGPAYMFYMPDANSPSGVDYAVYMLSATDTVRLAGGPLAVCNHGDNSPSNAEWGYHHIDGCPDRHGHGDQSSGAAAGPSNRRGSYFIDTGNSAWLTCDQGCCTSDNMFQM